jgi:NADPH-ferrihemoprotein reductase
MASISYADLLSPATLERLSKIAIPKTIADYAAISMISLAGATFLTRGIVWDQRDPHRKLLFERPQLKDGEAVATVQKARNIAQILEETGKNVVIFWGSQSGTAEGLAHRLRRELHSRFGQEAIAADLSDYDPGTIALIKDSKFAIFLVSTYGEGDPSDNTIAFWDWITKTENTFLANLRYAAFGLGSSNYKFYNRVVDVVVEHLDRFGATSMMPVGKANDSEGTTEEDFLTWKNELFHMFTEKLDFQERHAGYSPALVVEEDPSLEPIDLHQGEPPSQNRHTKSSAQNSSVRGLRVLSTRQLFNSESRHCLHLEFDISDHPDLIYKTGDHLGIWAMNPDSEVNRLLRVLGLSERKTVPLSIKSLDSTAKLTCPTPTTTEALLRYYLEICAPVARDNILGLAQFAPTAEAKSLLLKLGRDKESYAEFTSRTHVNLGRLLELACSSESWSTLPLSYILEILPHMQPRFYSVSSSSVVSPRNPTITAVVSTTHLAGNAEETVHGLASNYLLGFSRQLESKSHPYGLTYQLDGPSNALQGGKVFALLRRSNFKLPTMSSTSLIMVAAGTGLAPFRAFLTERGKMLSIGKPVGEMILFFGCRHPDEDFIYSEELETLEKELSGRLRIVTAFSRFNGRPKQYVQDRVTELRSDVVRLIDEGATFYVCGRVTMAQAVEMAVGQAMKQSKGWDEGALDQWSTAIKRRHKWQEDVWA